MIAKSIFVFEFVFAYCEWALMTVLMVSSEPVSRVHGLQGLASTGERRVAMATVL